jgi:glycosyltransferase involved in cell wall biosynthesis
MDKAPTVSIVLPVWNGEKYLAGALDSVLGQTYRNFELIIVNDCSTDSSPRIAEDYARKDSRIRVLHNTKNLKLPASLNRGFKEARGRYLTWTSDDNLLHPTFLETLLGELESSQADVVYSNANDIDEDGKFLRFWPTGDPEGLVCQNTIGASFLYKREVHEALGGYDTKRFLYEDYDFWIRAYLQGFRYRRSYSVVYDYRRHAGALTSSEKLPQAFFEYKYELRKRFVGIDRRVAFEARSILTGYRKALGIRRWLWLFIEAFPLDPVGTLKLVGRFGRRLVAKIA